MAVIKALWSSVIEPRYRKRGGRSGVPSGEMDSAICRFLAGISVLETTGKLETDGFGEENQKKLALNSHNEGEIPELE